MKKFVVLFIIALIAFELGNARPQYSILQTYGTKCQYCHIQPNYGGQRSAAGFLARKDMALIDPASIGLEGLYSFLDDKNSYFDDNLIFGIDMRLQNARWAQSSKLTGTRDSAGNIIKPTLERKTMVMQLMPYLQASVFDWLTIEGTYNFSYDIEDKMRYKAQQPGWATATIKPFEGLPSLRVGYIPVPIGLDYDDHTYLVRQVVGGSRANPLVSADMAELGFLLDYNDISWLSASFGMFDSKNHADLTTDGKTPVVNSATMSNVFNLSFHPEVGSGINTFFGLSHLWNGNLKTDDGIYFGNGYYTITSFFFNIGLADQVALMTEYMTSNKQDVREVNNFLVELNYQILEPFNVFARYEVGKTNFVKMNKGEDVTFEANQYVFGTHFYPLPFMDFLVEYRIYERAEVAGYSSQWAVQFHLFY